MHGESKDTIVLKSRGGENWARRHIGAIATRLVV